MITSQFFGHPRLNKNLGNQLFELASLIGLSKRYKTDLYLPDNWHYSVFFKFSSDFINNTKESFITIEEPAFHCCLDFFDRLKKIIKDEYVNIEGYLQSEEYWKPFKDEILRAFTFNDELELYSKSFLIKHKIDIKQYVAISVRRGDFETDPFHYLLPIEYYLGALQKHFSDKYVVVFSDDINWCRENFKFTETKVLFSENLNAIEQLSLMSKFQNFIIANSTFSWWGAYLSKNKTKKVIRPYHHFDGELKLKANIKDHYPKEWFVFNYENDC